MNSEKIATHYSVTDSRLVRRMSWNGRGADLNVLLNREWLVANGLGGFALSSIAGLNTRKYHGMFVAALPSPLGRVFPSGAMRFEALLSKNGF